METIEKTVWNILKKFEKSAQLRGRIVGSAPTIEWTGLATATLQKALLDLKYSFTFFCSDVKGQSLYGRRCICFVTFGTSP